MTVNEKIDYLFSKIKWETSFLDSKAISIVTSLKKDIEEEKKERIGEIFTLSDVALRKLEEEMFG